MSVYNDTNWSVSSKTFSGEGHCEPDFAPSNIDWFESVLPDSD